MWDNYPGVRRFSFSMYTSMECLVIKFCLQQATADNIASFGLVRILVMLQHTLIGQGLLTIQ